MMTDDAREQLSTLLTELTVTSRTKLDADGSEQFAIALLLVTPSPINRAWRDAATHAEAIAAVTAALPQELSPALKTVLVDVVRDNPDFKEVFKSTAKLFAEVYTGDPCPSPAQSDTLVKALRNA
jgi:hypothetical protein